MPHLKRGAMRDFLNIMEQHGYFKEDSWNRTDYIYTFESGNKIEFFSLDMPHKVRGPRRKRLFINEANNIPRETFDQLEVRTEEEIWLDWNPTAPFWFHEDLQQREDVDSIILTYLDNEGLPESIVKSIEARKVNRNWWRVYGEGQLGEVEGRIYTGWKLDLETIPHEARLERRGLDFGYSADPAALVDVYYMDNGYILDERLYQTGMRNSEISSLVKNLEQPQTLIIADSAEPKSIDDLKMYGLNVLPAVKGQGSVNQGINYVQEKRIWVTKRSVNLIKEYRTYMWKFDKDGRQLSIPEDVNNHAMDALRYAIQSLNVKTDVPVYKPRQMLQRKYGH
jgi:phage terminase large subunit